MDLIQPVNFLALSLISRITKIRGFKLTSALNEKALKKLADGFGFNSEKYNAIIEAAEKSSFLAGELNAFGNFDGWSFATGEIGKGVYTNPTDRVIAFDPTWSEAPNVFATTLAHELGHALLLGGTGGSPALDADQWKPDVAVPAGRRSNGEGNYSWIQSEC
ncbi:TPA: hypothetical protein ACV4T7_002847 [Burkholderia ambifaria]